MDKGVAKVAKASPADPVDPRGLRVGKASPVAKATPRRSKTQSRRVAEPILVDSDPVEQDRTQRHFRLIDPA